MLTSKVIKELKAKDRRYQITDSDGLALRVQRSGVKSWVLRVPQNGRIVDITLGHWPEVTLQHARALARQRKKELELEPSGSYTVSAYQRSDYFASRSQIMLRWHAHIMQYAQCAQIFKTDSVTTGAGVEKTEKIG